MKHYLSFIFSCLLWFIPWAARADSGVLLLLTNGKTVEFAFKDSPTVVFGSNLLINVPNGTSVEYAYSEVSKLYWGDNSSTSIDLPKVKDKSKIVFNVIDNALVANGLAKGERISVYMIDGNLVNSASSNADGGSAVINLPNHRNQIYIVRTSSGVSYKFIKH